MSEHAIPIPPDLFEALAARAAEIASEQAGQQRWAVGIEGLTDYLRCSLREARQFREKGLPAKRVGKRVVFDLRAVDEWFEREGDV